MSQAYLAGQLKDPFGRMEGQKDFLSFAEDKWESEPLSRGEFLMSWSAFQDRYIIFQLLILMNNYSSMAS